MGAWLRSSWSWLRRSGCPGSEGPLDLRYDAGRVLHVRHLARRGPWLPAAERARRDRGDPVSAAAAGGRGARTSWCSAPAIPWSWEGVSGSAWRSCSSATPSRRSRWRGGSSRRGSRSRRLLAVLNAQTLFLSDFFAADLPYAAVSTFSVVPTGLGAGALAVAAFGLRTAGAGPARRVGRRASSAEAVAGGGRPPAVGLLALGSWQVYVRHVKSSPEFSRPAYAYQRADYQFYNVDYADNMAYVDPFRPELGLAGRAEPLNRLGTNLKGFRWGRRSRHFQRGWSSAKSRAYASAGPHLPLPTG